MKKYHLYVLSGTMASLMILGVCRPALRHNTMENTLRIKNKSKNKYSKQYLITKKIIIIIDYFYVYIAMCKGKKGKD